jgi:hypothetical protein
MMERSAELAKFREYPYRLLPDEKVTIWAGYPTIKAQLLRLVESARSDRVGLYQFTALHGELGTGKSHALRFLSYYIGEEHRDEYQSLVTYLPRVAVDARTDFVAIYRAIIRSLRVQLREVAERLSEQIEELADQRRHASGRKVAERDTIRRDVITEIGGADAAILEMLLKLAVNESSAMSDLLGDKRNDLIANEYEAVRALGALVRFSTRGVGTGEPPAKCVYVFLDEIEAIADFPSAMQVSINNGLRDTVNAAPEAFCLLVGLTGDAAYLEGLFDTNLISRLTTEPIEFGPLDVPESMAFVQELHQAYRQDGAGVDDNYPFTEDALQEIIAMTTDKTPRALLRSCRVVLEQAVLQGGFDGHAPITPEQVDEYLV